MCYYLKIKYTGKTCDLPAIQYVEVGKGNNAIRTVEIFRDGKVGWTETSTNMEKGGAFIPEGSFPSIESIESEKHLVLIDFEIHIIEKIAFFSIFQSAKESFERPSP